MQSQPALVDLARARLRLLGTVCLPSVVGQSVWGQFLWVIRTDPGLDADVRAELVELLSSAGALAGGGESGGRRDRALTYVVGSNDNYIVSNSTTTSPDISPFDVRDMLRNALADPDSIMAGGPESMRTLLAEIEGDDGSLSSDDVVLWTRLDADDGLSVEYMEHIQTQAVRYFLPQNYDGELLESLPGADDDGDDGNRTYVDNTYVPPDWMYWCSGRNIDWFVGSDDPARRHEKGTVSPVFHANVCVTPGVTVALRSGVDPSAVPRLDHDRIVSELRVRGGSALCGRSGLAVYAPASAEEGDDEDEDSADEDDPDDGSCFHMVKGDFSAVRSRTPTSAGMMGVHPDPTQLAIEATYPQIVPVMWRSVEEDFAMNFTEMAETVSYFAEHLYEIAEDNARGQCTKGHSCKTSSKDRLGQYVDLRVEGAGGLNVVDGTIVAG
ncbi:hypothetical protein THAOC_04373 [Thalassiosira oceanica]|uniref:Uncharacterized protein n=1 Tax=Thalassiosira oceanica TaxID=159749 RepID=K0TNY8_THAOC|nr:hypothetical protein THAOC_04373 [Thalassiosira oceanica]|eukprot:EJK73977.1 hypothetical protein THAOC_04373 [Thalassiosira oceanica]